MTRKAAWLTMWALVLGACRGGGVTPVEVGFRVEESRVDFGRVLELDSSTRTVSVINTGRSVLHIELATEGPFSAPAQLELLGGSDARLPVRFTAGNGPASGKLQLSANGVTVSVDLVGEGVRPLPCLPSAACRLVRFELETHSCVESAAPNGSGCIPSSMCLENGLCQDGKCVGVQRACDDKNKCTADGCAEGIGCVNPPMACPASGNPCKVPVCDPETGCAEVDAPDSTPCGAVDCVTAHLCVAGECKAVPTPDGLLCAPRTPCQGEGRCQSQQCVRPPPGDMLPSHVVPLALSPAVPARVLGHQGNVFATLCGAGDSGCRLQSWTGSGFERFSVPLDGGGSPSLVHVADETVLLLEPRSIQSYSAANGALRWRLPYDQLTPPPGAGASGPVCSPERVASAPGGAVVAALSWSPYVDAGVPDGGLADASVSLPLDGGPPLQTIVWVGADGGLVAQGVLAERGESALALDRFGRAYAYEPSGPLTLVQPQGTSVVSQPLAQVPGERSLSVSHALLWVGGKHLVHLDGGVQASMPWVGAGGEPQVLHGPQLLSADRGYALYKTCVPAAMSCLPEQQATMVRVFTAGDGGTLWEATVLPEGTVGGVTEAALVSGGAIMTLSQNQFDAGPEAYLQAFSEGKRLFVCPLPEGALPSAAVFERGYLHALVSRDGGWRLESYELEQIPLETTGWPQAHGVSGARQAR